MTRIFYEVSDSHWILIGFSLISSHFDAPSLISYYLMVLASASYFTYSKNSNVIYMRKVDFGVPHTPEEISLSNGRYGLRCQAGSWLLAMR